MPDAIGYRRPHRASPKHFALNRTSRLTTVWNRPEHERFGATPTQPMLNIGASQHCPLAEGMHGALAVAPPRGALSVHPRFRVLAKVALRPRHQTRCAQAAIVVHVPVRLKARLQSAGKVARHDFGTDRIRNSHRPIQRHQTEVHAHPQNLLPFNPIPSNQRATAR